MNYMQGFKQHVCWSLTLVALASSCSLRDRDVSYGVSLQLSSSAKQSLAKAALFNSAVVQNPQANPSVTPAAGISGFQCFALNITGPGLKSDPRFGCTSPESKMGIMAGLAAVEGGKVEAMVPAGASRTIQLIGVQSTVGCPSFEEMLKAKDPATGEGGMDGLGDPYLLGSVTIDVFGDTTVHINPVFDANAKLFKDCGDGGGNGSQSLTFRQPNQDPALQRSACMPVAIEAHYNSSNSAGPWPSVKPQVVSIAGTGAVELFTDSGCVNAYNNSSHLDFPAAQPSINLYAHADAGVTGFKIQNSTTATGWETPVVEFQLVSNRLELPTPHSQPRTMDPSEAGCNSFNLGYWDSAATFHSLPIGQDFLMTVYNNSTRGATASGIEFYYDYAECDSRVNAIASTFSGSQKRFNLNLPTDAPIYYRNPKAETLSLGLSAVDHSMQPAMIGITFAPFSLSSGSPYETTKDGGTKFGTTLYLYFGGGANNVSALKINNKPCTIVSQSSYSINCQPQPNPPGVYPLVVVVNDSSGNPVDYPTQSMVTYNRFSAGDGYTNPYEIDDPTQLAEIKGNYAFRKFILTADLDLGSFPPNSLNGYFPTLYGEFNGAGHIIQNLNYPLVAECMSGSAVKQLILNASISTNATYLGAACGISQGILDGIRVNGSVANVGSTSDPNMATAGLVGKLSGSGFVNNCRSTATISDSAGANGTLGGLIGVMNGGNVDSSGAAGSVTSVVSTGIVGGFIGRIDAGSIIRSFAQGAVQGKYKAGGFVGAIAQVGVSITQSFAQGNVYTLGNYAGGFVGYQDGGTISNSASFGSVQATSYVGGFAGYLAGGSIDHSYANAGAIIGSNAFTFSNTSGNISDCYAVAVSGATLGGGYALSQPDSIAEYAAFDFTSNTGIWQSRAPGSAVGNTTNTPMLRWACQDGSLGFNCFGI